MMESGGWLIFNIAVHIVNFIALWILSYFGFKALYEKNVVAFVALGLIFIFIALYMVVFSIGP